MAQAHPQGEGAESFSLAIFEFLARARFFCRTITTGLENQKFLENTAFLSFGTNATFLSNERIVFEKPKILGKYSIFEFWHERDFFVERTHPIRKTKNPWKIQHFEKTQHFVERTHHLRKTKNPWKIQHFEKTQPFVGRIQPCTKTKNPWKIQHFC